MLIRNAKIEGYPGLVDLRLMHGAVQEIGVSLQKGLYEAELDVQGDVLHPWQGEPLPRGLRHPKAPAVDAHIMPGTPGPLMRCDRTGRLIGPIHQHTAD